MVIDYKEAGSIAAAGAMGGIVSIIYANVKGVQPVIAWMPWGALAYIALGAIAAILGVYLLARTDTKQVTHCLAFSIACGIFWAPIFEGASALVEKRKEQAIQAEVSKFVQETKVALRQLPVATEQELPQRTAEVVNAVQGLAAASADISDLKLVKTIALSYDNAKSALEELRPKNPQLIDKAMTDVREAQLASSYGALIYKGQAFDPNRVRTWKPTKDEDPKLRKRAIPEVPRKTP